MPVFRDLPNPGSESMSLLSSALAGGFFTTSAPWEARVPYTTAHILDMRE